jgi:uncharacterized protein (DUF1684 family)
MICPCNMKKSTLLIIILVISVICPAQQSYRDSIHAFIKDYTDKHEVVTGDNKKFLSFYPIDKNYRVIATFESVQNGKWFTMKTSGTQKKVYRVYGTIHFTIHDTTLKLNIYQSQDLIAATEYKEYLFLPFTDLTSGEESYASGRYIDLVFKDIVNNKIVIDFNKAYNPYCAYVSGKYNCPIPPRENNLNVTILAGEKNYGKQH